MRINHRAEASEAYKAQKRVFKQLLTRKQFTMTGKYQFPTIKKQDIDLDTIELINITKTKQDDVENNYRTVHFFTHDWHFDNVYDKPQKSFEKLDQYYALLSPDYSMFVDMPLALQIHSTFKNRWCGAYWQSLGKRVIPTVTWGDERSFEFCFDGIEQGSVVAVCTHYRQKNKTEFMHGYNKMLEVIKPSAIICYELPFPEMKGNIKVCRFDEDWGDKKMTDDIYAEQYFAKHL